METLPFPEGYWGPWSLMVKILKRSNLQLDVSQPELCLELRIVHLEFFFFFPQGFNEKYDICVLSVWQSKI